MDSSRSWLDDFFLSPSDFLLNNDESDGSIDRISDPSWNKSIIYLNCDFLILGGPR